MKPRKTKDLQKVLSKKGFEINPEKDHHKFFYLTIKGIKQDIYTYFSHGKDEYNESLMGQIKKQLRFSTAKQAEDFFDCPMSADGYVAVLKESKAIK